jgi:Tol biopolymer transport system component
MKKYITLLLFCFFTSLATTSAVEDKVFYSSLDGANAVRNIGDKANSDHHFQIVSRSGEVLLSSAKHPELESGSFAENISWSADGRYVAFSVRTSGPYMYDTFIFSVRSKQLILVPTDDKDYQTRPIRWHNNHTLIVQTNGPFGGKATEEMAAAYRSRRTIRISESPLKLETLYKTP